MALGGIGEIGMNCYLYGLGPADDRQWLMVDLGITFPEGENDPGVDVILPDLRFIEAERGSLAGLVLTHAHEDHFGAVIELWPRLKVPIYATPFTAALLKAKLAEYGGGAEAADPRGARSNSRFEVGPFGVELISVAHSIPESNALAIRTPHGIGAAHRRLEDRSDAGDRRRRPTRTGSPRSAPRACWRWSAIPPMPCARAARRPSWMSRSRSPRIIKGAKRRVAVTIFASNVARLQAVADAARARRPAAGGGRPGHASHHRRGD